jgi:predicted  nucleic acid-binding Zn-ribbon protein
MPASKREWARIMVLITKLNDQVNSLKETDLELRNEVTSLRKEISEKEHDKRDRRFALYLAIISLLSAILAVVLERFIL